MKLRGVFRALLSLFVIGIMNYSSAVFSADNKENEFVIVEYKYSLTQKETSHTKGRLVAAGSLTTPVGKNTSIGVRDNSFLFMARLNPKLREGIFSPDTKVISEIEAEINEDVNIHAYINETRISDVSKGEVIEVPLRFIKNPAINRGYENTEYIFSFRAVVVKVNDFSRSTK